MGKGSEQEGSGRRRHLFYLDYDKVWTIGELQAWLEDCLALGADRSSVLRYRSRGTLGQSGFAGLEVALPLPARDAGGEPEGSPPSEGGDSVGETPT